MAESIVVDKHLDKAGMYEALLPQIFSLTGYETDLIANLANTAAALKECFGFFWVGFYLVQGNELVLGPFQGPVACTRIAHGKGVCGTAWADKKTVIVDDVEQFPGHIACSSASRSEIVVPVVNNGEVLMVLDVDSDRLAAFDQTDAFYLGQIADNIAAKA